MHRLSPFSVPDKVKKLVINSYAKLNLYLDVLDKRKDNYHNIITIFERINLCDRICLKTRLDGKIKIITNSPEIPKGSANLAYKSAKLLQDNFNLNKGVDIEILKSIPVGSGMGGGSSNAASVLAGLNRLWGLNIKRDELAKYAKNIGADVPFFIYDTPFALGEQRGDKIKPLNTLKEKKYWHVLVIPRLNVSTPLIFKKWDEFNSHFSNEKDYKITLERQLTLSRYNVKLLSLALRRHNLSLIERAIFNRLEDITTKVYPEITRIREKLVHIGLNSVLMSGSGPTMFGFVSSRKEALFLCRRLKRNRLWRVLVTHTL